MVHLFVKKDTRTSINSFCTWTPCFSSSSTHHRTICVVYSLVASCNIKFNINNVTLYIYAAIRLKTFRTTPTVLNRGYFRFYLSIFMLNSIFLLLSQHCICVRLLRFIMIEITPSVPKTDHTRYLCLYLLYITGTYRLWYYIHKLSSYFTFKTNEEVIESGILYTLLSLSTEKMNSRCSECQEHQLRNL